MANRRGRGEGEGEEEDEDEEDEDEDEDEQQQQQQDKSAATYGSIVAAAYIVLREVVIAAGQAADHFPIEARRGVRRVPGLHASAERLDLRVGLQPPFGVSLGGWIVLKNVSKQPC